MKRHRKKNKTLVAENKELWLINTSDVAWNKYLEYIDDIVLNGLVRTVAVSVSNCLNYNSKKIEPVLSLLNDQWFSLPRFGYLVTNGHCIDTLTLLKFKWNLW
jgi:hypothetical protein